MTGLSNNSRGKHRQKHGFMQRLSKLRNGANKTGKQRLHTFIPVPMFMKPPMFKNGGNKAVITFSPPQTLTNELLSMLIRLHPPHHPAITLIRLQNKILPPKKLITLQQANRGLHGITG